MESLPKDVLGYVFEFVHNPDTLALCRAVCKQWRTLLTDTLVLSRQRDKFIAAVTSEGDCCFGIAAMIDSPLTDLILGLPKHSAALRSREFALMRGFFNDAYFSAECRDILLRKRGGCLRRLSDELGCLRRYGSIVIRDCDVATMLGLLKEQHKASGLTESDFETNTMFPVSMFRVIGAPTDQAEIPDYLIDTLRESVECLKLVPFALIYPECKKTSKSKSDGVWSVDLLRWRMRLSIAQDLRDDCSYAGMNIQAMWLIPGAYPFKAPTLKMDVRVRHILREPSGHARKWNIPQLRDHWSPALTLVNVTQTLLNVFTQSDQSLKSEHQYLDSKLYRALHTSREAYYSLLLERFHS